MSSMAAVGDVLAGKYRVDKVLGIGGMGMVVAATHLELETKVALKFMLPDALASDQAMDRFLREAKAAVRLRSEHICRVLDVGKLANGAPYIVMELMEGRDFAQLIRARGALPIGDAVDHVMQAIEGLAEAHANGIVHRDLKPGNLFVCADNDGSALVKVLDFGISKSSLGAGAMATKTGDIMGSPAFMAPEQMLSSKNVDARADVWALGVILYQAVTGALPFDADTLPALCMAVMNTEPPAPDVVRAGLPAAFGAVVMRCLAKAPDARWASVAELSAALVPFGGEDAAGSAKRAGKVLRQKRTASGASAVAPDAAAMAAGVAPTLMTDSDLRVAAPARAVAAPVGRISTLQSSAAEVASAAPTAAGRSRTGWYAAMSALVVAGIVGVAVIAGGGGGGAAPVAPVVAPASQPVPAPAPVAPAPEPLPVAPRPVAAPPEPAPVPTPTPTPTPTPVVHKPHASLRSAAAKPAVATPPTIVAKPADPTPAPATVAPAPPPAPSSDDKWTHMQHDKGNH